MGIILSRIRKKTAPEKLENIDEEIKELEACDADTRLRHQKIIQQLTVYFSGLCVLFAIVLYFYTPQKLQSKIILMALVLLSLIYLIKKITSWYYERKIESSRERLKDLKKEKKRLVDEIMDKETYKVAKEILEKYAPETLPPKYSSPNFNTNLTASSAAERGLRNRTARTPSSSVMKFEARDIPYQANRLNFNARAPVPAQRNQLALTAPGVVQGTNRFNMGKSYVERFFEYLIGDGPSSRYALICSNCSTHNGMALQEEFEYMAFKCYSCFMLNPARKQRPAAPKLDDVNLSRDTPESDSWSSSVFGEHGTLKIEELESDDKDQSEDRDSATELWNNDNEEKSSYPVVVCSSRNDVNPREVEDLSDVSGLEGMLDESAANKILDNENGEPVEVPKRNDDDDVEDNK